MRDCTCNSNTIYNERSLPHKLFDTATQTVRQYAMGTPNEAADLNHSLLRTNLRWIPVGIESEY